jgi:selenocysteine-specific translation elongation factor
LKSINFVLLGDQSIASQLGKKGTSTDITIHDRKTSDVVFTWTTPTMFPEKVQSLIQAANIAEYAILNVATLDKYLGEQIIALDCAGITEGFVLHSYSVDRDKLRSVLKTTALSGYSFLDSVDELKSAMTNLEPRGREGPALVSIDHAFDVKGVGTVALGVVRQGTIKVYDELFLTPNMKPVMIKSIQMHDDPVQSSSSPARVGLAIKGVTAEEISRGDIICTREAVSISSGPLPVKFTKSPIYKGELADNQMYMLSVGMQIRPARIRNSDGSLEISAEKPVAFQKGQSCVLLKPDNQGTRIIGKGQIQ